LYEVGGRMSDLFDLVSGWVVVGEYLPEDCERAEADGEHDRHHYNVLLRPLLRHYIDFQHHRGCCTLAAADAPVPANITNHFTLISLLTASHLPRCVTQSMQ